MSFIKKSLLTRLLLTLLLLQPVLALGAGGAAQRQEFAPLAKRLIADGFEAKRISRLYRPGGVVFDMKGMSLFFRHNEATLNYRQFLSPANLAAARKYMKTHEPIFQQTEKKFGVNRRVIVAIILVETRLGHSLGNRSIIDTLSSMASLSDPGIRKRLWSEISRHHWLSRKHFELKADRRSAWAYRELSAFLTFAFREKLDPLKARGSYAGAMGICQFMPSNLLAYGADGDRNGSINPYANADAIASIGNYLKHFGWHPNIKEKAAYKVVMHYNRSRYYATTVLRIAEKLKG
jgi:peptidoglycan lytic transglycosylase B